MLKAVLSEQEERIIYYVTLASVLAGLLVYAILSHFGFHLVGTVPNCIFKQVTGLYCPGCGGTHALEAFLHGHVWQSFLYHPLVLYLALVVGLFLVTHTLHLLSAGRFHFLLRFREVYLYGALLVIFINWIVRNILLVAYGITIY